MNHDAGRRPAEGNEPPQEPAARPEETPYHRAVRFDGRRAEQDAEQAYRRSRRDVQRASLETDLSVFRLQIGPRIGDIAYLGWYVALIGTRPDAELAARLEQNLAGGTPVELEEKLIAMLRERRARDATLAPWVERKHGRLTKAELYQRPGRGEKPQK